MKVYDKAFDEMSMIMKNKTMPLKLKRKICNQCVFSVMTYDTSWITHLDNENKSDRKRLPAGTGKYGNNYTRNNKETRKQ